MRAQVSPLQCAAAHGRPWAAFETAREPLPDISPQVEVARATGTDGTAVLGSCLVTPVRFDQIEGDEPEQVSSRAQWAADSRGPLQIQVRTPIEAEEEVVRALGIEPTTYGLRVPNIAF